MAWMGTNALTCQKMQRIDRVAMAVALLAALFAATPIGAQAPSPAGSSPVLAPANQRFASPTAEVPHLRRHVVPLLSRLGCNAAACHGAKGGQGDFELSLFGFDYQADIQELADEGDPPRANWKDPLDSLVLQKPTLAVDHLGGKRFDAGGWEYQLLLQWIEARAPGVKKTQESIVVERLEIRPAEVVFQAKDEAAASQLQVLAHWNDGSVEDVTPLCRFQCNDDAVATVSIDGNVTKTGFGDTHVVAFYDQAIASAPVLSARPSTATAETSLANAPPSVDGAINAKLTMLGIEASAPCSDADFLRRVSLDLTGTLPTAAAVRSFVALPDPDKRAKKIDELLLTEQYAAWWATWLCDLTGNNQTTLPTPDFQAAAARQWHQWIARRIRDNVPYDQIVEGLVVSSGRQPNQSYADYCAEMTSYVRSDSPADFSERQTMPYFWARTNVNTPAKKTLAFAYTFLGVQIQCAECHKHPFDRWTKSDFEGLQAFFADIKYGRPPSAAKEHEALLASIVVPEGMNSREFLRRRAAAGETIPWGETYVQAAARTQTSDAQLRTLMDWMKSLEHPYMAMALVNRVWHHYFGVGIVDPPDDLSLANPPANRALLDYLTVGFVSSGYDMRWLHREILNSQAYQRSAETNDTNESDRRNFSHALFRRLPAEVLYDSAQIATAANQSDASKVSELRAVGVGTGLTRGDRRFGTLVALGKPPRTEVCERERSSAPSLMQSLFLQNHPDVHAMINRRDGWIEQQAPRLQDADEEALKPFVEEAFLRTLGRAPTADERRQSLAFIIESSTRREGAAGLLWALLNTKEFAFNH
jgi:hypothetical protein